MPNAGASFPRLTRRALPSLLGLAMTGAAPGNALFVDASQFVYAISAEQPEASVVDTETHRIVDRLALGLVAVQAVVSRGEAKLVASNGHAESITVVDLPDHSRRTLAIGHASDRLVLGTGGWLMVAVNTQAGLVTLLDLRRERVLGTLRGLPRLRDVMFGNQDGVLYVAAEGWPGIGVVTVNDLALTEPIALLHSPRDGLAALARMPNGRSILAVLKDGGPIGIVDTERGIASGELAVSSATLVSPSGTGRLLFVLDNVRANLHLFDGASWLQTAALGGAPAMIGVYSAWLDSMAVVPTGTDRTALIFDLDHPRLVDEIRLAGTPVAGCVTADSRTVYLALSQAPGLAVIDGQTRRLVTTLVLPSSPLLAIAPGGWGVCH